MPEKRIAVIDGNSLMHRAFHAVPPTMNAPDGTPTNAVFGFISMLLKFLDVSAPDAVVCAFDAGRPAFRMEALEQYKAQRPPMDDALRAQFPIIEELLESMNIPVVRVAGWEGDDVLGTVAARDEQLGFRTLLVSGDKDVYQLCSELTHVMTTRKGITDIAIYGPDEVRQRYGVGPEQFPDFLGLKGDSSDNIPGVPGVGDKTAAKLLGAYGSLEGIYEHIDELKGKQKERLVENRDAAFISRKVATIVRDLDFELDLEGAAFPAFSAEAVSEAFSKYRFNAHLKRVLSLIDETPARAFEPIEVPSRLEGIYEHIDELKGKQKERLVENRDAAFISRKVATIVRDLDFELDLEGAAFPAFSAEAVSEAFSKYRFNAHLKRVLSLIDETPARAFEPIEVPSRLEGPAAEALVDAAIASGERIGAAFVDAKQASLFGGGSVLALAAEGGCATFEGDAADAVFARVVREGNFAMLDVKGALHRVYPADTSRAALVTDDDLMGMRAFDVALAGYVLNSSGEAYTYDALLDAYAGKGMPETKTDADAACAAASAARLLADILSAALEREGSARAYFDIDLPLVAVLAIMERTGAALDATRLSGLGASVAEELSGLRGDIIALAGEEFNIDSPKQLGHILFEVLGLPARKKTQRGYSTDAKVLKELAKVHELPELVLRYRELAKIKSTYIDALPRLVAADGRVHTTFNETVTATGRLSSSDPNLQNIPVRTDFGRHIRECFVALEPGCKFLSADYSQIELRLLAHLSGDESLIESFSCGADFHAATASRVFGVPVAEVTPQLRSRAKAVNFGIVYGQQAFGLAQSLGIPFGEAKEMIERYFEVHPGVRAYLDETVAAARSCGWAETMFGRKRHIPELASANGNTRSFGERTAMNHPMQGSAADIIKLAMRQVQQRLADEGFSARLMLQVHDELDFSVPQDEVEALSAMVRDVMENVVALKVPLLVDVAAADTWAQAH